jgi:hypothetical protein
MSATVISLKAERERRNVRTWLGKSIIELCNTSDEEWNRRTFNTGTSRLSMIHRLHENYKAMF